MRLPTGRRADRVWNGLRSAVDAAYAPTSPTGPNGAGPLPVPSITSKDVTRPMPDEGGGLDARPEMWADMVYHSAKLSSPMAMGHMGEC